MSRSHRFELKDKIAHWVMNNYAAIFIFCIIEMIVVLHSGSIWEDVKQHTVSSYSLSTTYQTDVLISGEETKRFHVDIHDIHLTGIEFYADILELAESVEWKLIGTNGECISTGQLSGDNYADGKYRIELGETMLQSIDNCQLELMLTRGGSIQVYKDTDNVLKAVYYYEFHYTSIIRIIIILINIGVAILLLLLLSRVSIYKKFWIIAVSTGVFSIVLVIPLSTPDEFRHFARAYSIAEGNSFCRYDEQREPYADIPSNIYNLRYMAPENVDQVADETNFTINISRWIYYLRSEDNDNRTAAWMGGVHEKGILEYLPQVIAIKIGMLLGVRQIWLFYWARVGNWFAAALLCFLSIKLAPKYKFFFLVLYCMPTNIILACTSSTDGLVNALVMLSMSLCMRCYYGHKNLLDKKVLLVLFVISVYIAILKLPYMLVIYLFAVLDPEVSFKRGDWKKILKNFMILTGICLLGYGAASCYKEIYASGSSTNNYAEFILYVINHKFEFFRVLFLQEFLYKFDEYYRGALSVNSLNITVLVMPYTILMVYGGACEKSNKNIKTIQLMLVFLICSAIWFIVLLAAYLWTGIGATQLWGVQGRYMCPVIMIGSLFFALNDKIYSENSGKYIPVFCMLVLLVAFMNIVQIQWV